MKKWKLPQASCGGVGRRLEATVGCGVSSRLVPKEECKSMDYHRVYGVGLDA